MKQKLVLALDSHALSCYQRCPQEHNLTYVEHLETTISKDFYDRGTLVHLMLGLYYRLRRRGFSSERAMMLILEKRFLRWNKLFNLSNDDKLLIMARFAEYVNHYIQEEVQTVGVEVGFSEKLFEDKNFIFIYEGRVDWLGFEKVGKEQLLHFVDHKTRSQAYSLDCFKNQFFGYAWMMKKVYGNEYKGWGKVNYFGLQEDKNGQIMKKGKLFEKVWFQLKDAQIKQWEQDTIWWFHRIAQSRMFNIFPRSWQCDTKFGVCSYKKICTAATAWEKKLVKIGGTFKKREKAWAAWE